MITATFTCRRAYSVNEAVGWPPSRATSQFLVGGHSLLPLMKLRLAQPEMLIDVGALRELGYIRDEGGHIAIGALTHHHDLEHSGLLASSLPLLAHAAGQVGDPQVRHRGTIGGSIAHSDPASDLPAVILALDATLVARGPSVTGRSRPAISSRACSRRCWNPMSCSPRSGCPSRGDWSSQKFTKRAIDWAIVGVAVRGRRGGAGRHGADPGAGRCRRSGPWPAGRPRPRRPRWPRTGPARARTSTPPRPTGSTWPGSWWAGPCRKPPHVTDRSPAPGPGRVSGRPARLGPPPPRPLTPERRRNDECSHQPPVPRRPRRQPAPPRQRARGPRRLRGRPDHRPAVAGRRGCGHRRRGGHAAETPACSRPPTASSAGRPGTWTSSTRSAGSARRRATWR